MFSVSVSVALHPDPYIEMEQQLMAERAKFKSWKEIKAAEIEKIDHPVYVHQTNINNYTKEIQPIIKRENLSEHTLLSFMTLNGIHSLVHDRRIDSSFLNSSVQIESIESKRKWE